MKRYLLFAYDDVYAGGWNDYIGSYDSGHEANEYGMELLRVNWAEYYHVVDLETGLKVYGRDMEGFEDE